MPTALSRLRRWFAAVAILVVVIVAGVYFYARHRVQNALTQVPERIGIEVQQTATGFTVSKSEQGRTLFKLAANKAVQFKQGGQAELHDVTITLYGRDSSRYDRIYGSTFDYNQQSGEAIARGEVQIDLEANPEGVRTADQLPPQALKNLIHLKTSDLIFEQRTGDAYTRNRVDFRLTQATGSAMGLNYVAKTNVLTLESQVECETSDAGHTQIAATRAVIDKIPRQVMLDQPKLRMVERTGQAEKAILFLRPDDSLDRVLAWGNVSIELKGNRNATLEADQLELTMVNSNTPRVAVFTGSVKGQVAGDEPFSSDAGRVVVDFASNRRVTKVRAENGVRLLEYQRASGASALREKMAVTAPIIDFFFNGENLLEQAVTSGAAQIALPGNSKGREVVLTAGEFRAHFLDTGRISSLHGAPDARIVSQNPGEEDRISVSPALDGEFDSRGEIASILQSGGVAYVDAARKAWSDRARYTPSDQMLVLSGSPRVTEGQMTTTAHAMRLNRATGDAIAEGDVRSTYSDLKPQPGGALLASSSPIHVTARTMTLHRAAAIAVYTGGARLWQDANTVEAASIEFNRDRRSMVARGMQGQPVSTVLVQVEKSGNPVSVALHSSYLSYTDDERRVHLEQNAIAYWNGVTIASQQMDAFLEPRGQNETSPPSRARLERIVASEQVEVHQATRQAVGNRLTYSVPEDRFVLTGGPPSIFDAERGKITGVSLTFYRGDDRVLVEGNNSSPTVTQTRVAR
jgi:lipopolysaccharide export system protein LptA